MEPFLKLGLTLLIVALNGFFVAAEFAFVRVRQTRIAELVESGNTRAKAVQGLLGRLDTYLSATQLGVTIASLALGYIGEPAMTEVLVPLFHAINLDKLVPNVHTIAVVLGFVVITSFHIIFGELLPKWWVIAHTEGTALGVAPIMRIFLKIGYPLIAILEHSAKVIARRLNIEPGDEREQAHSEDEILKIMEHSHREGALRPSEVELSKNMFDFAHTMAREIMVPRVDMVYLSTTWTVGRNVEVAIENGFTRYPLCESDRDHVIGMIHIKDLLAIAGDPKADISTVMRPIIGIPETKPIDELLKELQKSHTHQALVLDEYGGTAGLVTLEDIIEELIGEIQDEHDEPPPFVTLDEEVRRYSIAATVALEEVAERLAIPIENPEEYETIGGYALHKLRLAPRVGEQSNLDGFHVSISEVTGRRIKRLLFVKETPETVQAQEAADEAAKTATHE
ncbi:MAG: hemolysin family protein [Capsulimonas sp.]|uniref:hemolysin family protein n=1 Tax=Capsulimonas sp. TaxID=2494211 RepID=UPI003266C843